jgi:hypothetical protein
MKNLFFGLIATGFVTLSSFSSVQEDIVTRDNLKTVVDCKWRSCITQDGVRYCTEWTSGNCNTTESGGLVPIK